MSNDLDDEPRLRKTAMPDMTVVAAKRSLWIELIHAVLVNMVRENANQSTAEKTTAAFATLQTLPKQILELRKTARATKPANQKVMAMPSTARSAYCGAARGNFIGATSR